MEKETKPERKKPGFLRNDWHKKIKLGSKTKSKRRWSGAKGRHNKLRLCRKGHPARPKVGWGNPTKLEVKKIMNVSDLAGLKGEGILIGRVGLKKRKEILDLAKKQNLTILNKYKEKKK